MENTKGKVIGVNGNLVTASVKDKVQMNEVAFVKTGDNKLLKAEIIRVKNEKVELQVFESTKGIKIGDDVDFTSLLLTAELGPGLLGKVYDGLQNPLNELAEIHGFFSRKRSVSRPS